MKVLREKPSCVIILVGFGRNLVKTIASGLAAVLLDSSPAARRNRQEVPQEQPDVDPKPSPISLLP